MHYDYLVDASGEACPMPLLKAKMKLNKMDVGECVKVVASDESSVRDFASFISLTAHELKQAPISTPHTDEPDSGQSQYVYYIIKR